MPIVLKLEAELPKGEPLRVLIEKVVYGGFGLGRPAEPLNRTDSLLVPFTLPGELVDALAPTGAKEAAVCQILRASPHRVTPGCPHFGACGGCHLQMADYDEQLQIKREVLLDALQRAGLTHLPEPEVHAGEPWGYRNRIRLRLERVENADKSPGELRFGYTRHGGGNAFLPITTCPIAAPLLWRAAEAVLAVAARNTELAQWLAASREVEFFTNNNLSRLQITLLCPAIPKTPPARFERAVAALRHTLPELEAASALLTTWRPLRPGRALASDGPSGLMYAVAGERHWVARGGFFQVNRFLLPRLAELVCAGRAGSLAWDLFAGVGLFARVLAHSFRQVTAVEANPGAATELRSTLGRLGRQHKAAESTTLSFLQSAVLQRDRPDLIVLDPPRAGAGEEVCRLLLRFAAPEIVYVSCDPVTLGRDLAVLQRDYVITALHLVDLFPQTYHQEAVVTLRLRA